LRSTAAAVESVEEGVDILALVCCRGEEALFLEISR